MAEKPPLSFWKIWNMCFGFLGIQFGFALQNANVSRIFQTLGAEIEHIPILWVAAPLTGLLVQPIVGYMSDNTWTSLGRRRPYFFYGAIVTSLALIVMPHSPTLWIAAGLLWILDASINVTMEPFRAFVGDMLPSRQRTLGYVMQSFFIGIAAVVASALPWMLTNWWGVDNTAAEGEIPDSVRYAFYFGAAVLCAAVMWTVFSTREYSPKQMAAFNSAINKPSNEDNINQALAKQFFTFKKAAIWIAVGSVSTWIIYSFALDSQLYLLGIGAIAYGGLQLLAVRMEQQSQTGNAFYEICASFVAMPDTMKQLAWVQFFSWFALFAMWIYTTAAVTSHHYGSDNPQSAIFNQGADWVGVLFASYNGFAALAAMLIPQLSKYLGLRRTHQVNLLLGAAGFASFLIIKDPQWLLLSMIGVGFAWCSILSIPYVILSDAIEPAKMGVYMGIFNFFIVIPQILAASILGLLVHYLFSDQAIYALLLGAILWVFAAIAMQFVRYQE